MRMPEGEEQGRCRYAGNRFMGTLTDSATGVTACGRCSRTLRPPADNNLRTTLHLLEGDKRDWGLTPIRPQSRYGLVLSPVGLELT